MSEHGKDVIITLTGLEIGSKTGRLGPSTSVNITGQQIVVKQGILSAQTLITLIEKSEFPSLKQIVVLKIIDELADKGIIKAGEFISKIYDAFQDDPVSIEFIVDIVNSILKTQL